ncbi:hypothetical protein BJY52DRAFT_1285133 [Lactarius psammicola]|nr:hypothetical protein BJY52DRAFT_1285133 [Lactarius psammicola]
MGLRAQHVVAIPRSSYIKRGFGLVGVSEYASFSCLGILGSAYIQDDTGRYTRASVMRYLRPVAPPLRVLIKPTSCVNQAMNQNRSLSTTRGNAFGSWPLPTYQLLHRELLPLPSLSLTQVRRGVHHMRFDGCKPVHTIHTHHGRTRGISQ